ncbi:hypothetical protein EKL30_10255 [Candidimonas sp. SYP-B2681]|uniref:hypothetical protein n=1 Tax=Candidimonas sp. SYP-B2681 TaxID=2497686 RepID=UPI000F8630FA|nr:hypothetical protein [Candidimonas sp. SYP-B2681]RTZ43252.1 hypothetical protein EKL30_10255 [Candidimonas sp. SYP-B2681]
MARLPRLYAPHIPQLVQAEFAYPLAGPSDPAPAAELDRLLGWLHQDSRDLGVAVHGWVLMNDRLTLLNTPPDAQSLSRLIQSLGRRMATGMRHGRVFNGRYRSALVEPGRWVIPALIWLESLPVTMHYVDKAESWPWSSAPGHTGANTRNDVIVTDHMDYWQDGNTPFARQATYRERMHQGLSAAQRLRIEQALFGQWVLGEAPFLAKLESSASRRTAPAPRGRPRKSTASENKNALPEQGA